MKKVRVIIACIMVFGLLLMFQNVGAAPPETKDKAADVKKSVEVKDKTDVKKATDKTDVKKPVDPAKTDTKGEYHGNAKSKVYHAQGCKDYNCKNCTEKLASKDAAVKAGYKAHNCVK